MSRRIEKFQYIRQLVSKSRQKTGIYCKLIKEAQKRTLILRNYREQSLDDSKNRNIDAKVDDQLKRSMSQVQNRNNSNSKDSQRLKIKPKNQLEQEKKQENQSDEQSEFSFGPIKSRKEEYSSFTFREDKKYYKDDDDDQDIIPTSYIIEIHTLTKMSFANLKKIIEQEVNDKRNVSVQEWYEVKVQKFLLKFLNQISLSTQILQISPREQTSVLKKLVQKIKIQKLWQKKQRAIEFLKEYDKMLIQQFTFKPDTKQKVSQSRQPIRLVYIYYHQLKKRTSALEQRFKERAIESRNYIRNLASEIMQNDGEDRILIKIIKIKRKLKQINEKLKSKKQIQQNDKIFAKVLKQQRKYTNYKKLIDIIKGPSSIKVFGIRLYNTHHLHHHVRQN